MPARAAQRPVNPALAPGQRWRCSATQLFPCLGCLPERPFTALAFVRFFWVGRCSLFEGARCVVTDSGEVVLSSDSALHFCGAYKCTANGAFSGVERLPCYCPANRLSAICDPSLDDAPSLPPLNAFMERIQAVSCIMRCSNADLSLTHLACAVQRGRHAGKHGASAVTRRAASLGSYSQRRAC